MSRDPESILENMVSPGALYKIGFLKDLYRPEQFQSSVYDSTDYCSSTWYCDKEPSFRGWCNSRPAKQVKPEPYGGPKIPDNCPCVPKPY